MTLPPEFNEDHLRLAGGQAAAALAPQIQALQQTLASVPKPWWATVNFSMPVGTKMMTVLFRCQANPDGSLVDENGVEASQSFRESLGLAMVQGGSLVVRVELGLKVQRSDESGRLDWVNQDRLYGFQLANRDWEPVSEAQMRRAYAFDAQSGKPLPAVAGRTFATLRKPKAK